MEFSLEGERESLIPVVCFAEGFELTDGETLRQRLSYRFESAPLRSFANSWIRASSASSCIVVRMYRDIVERYRLDPLLDDDSSIARAFPGLFRPAETPQTLDSMMNFLN